MSLGRPLCGGRTSTASQQQISSKGTLWGMAARIIVPGKVIVAQLLYVVLRSDSLVEQEAKMKIK